MKGRGLSWRLLVWALMASAVFWTLLYRVAERGADVPDFVYAQF